jgi:hypothetical protein
LFAISLVLKQGYTFWGDIRLLKINYSLLSDHRLTNISFLSNSSRKSRKPEKINEEGFDWFNGKLNRLDRPVGFHILVGPDRLSVPDPHLSPSNREIVSLGSNFRPLVDLRRGGGEWIPF